MLPPRSSPSAEGCEGEGEHDGNVNRHIIMRVLGAEGGNVDSSSIVDRGVACRCTVKYASRSESSICKMRDSPLLEYLTMHLQAIPRPTTNE